MIRSVGLSLLAALLATKLSGQLMLPVFKNLPPDCTPDLSGKQRSKLIKEGSVTLTARSNGQTIQYSLDTLGVQKGYLKYEDTYVTGEKGFISFELRRFRDNAGKNFILYSRCGGEPTEYSQHELRLFEIKENGDLQEIKDQSLLPLNYSLDLFLKNETPDLVKAKISDMLCSCYDLRPKTTNEISYKNWPAFALEGGEEKWVLNFILKLHWNGKEFERMAIGK